MTKKIGDWGLSLKQELFCKYYVENKGNATDAYFKAYAIPNRDSARKSSSRLLKDPYILERIEEFLEESGLNNVMIDLELYALIKQNDDLRIKLRGIQEYNKLRRRYEKKPAERDYVGVDVENMSTDELYDFINRNK